MTTTDDPAPPKSPPLEVVVVAVAAPLPVVAAEPVPVAAVYPLPVSIADPLNPATGRPDPLPPNPTPAQLAVERVALHRANEGSFNIEAPKPPLEVPRPADPMRNLGLFYAFHIFEVVAIAILLLIGVFNFLALHPWHG